MRTYTSGTLAVIAPDEQVYTKEANILQVTSAATSETFDNCVTMTIDRDIENIGGLAASYVLSGGATEIDLQDIINVVKDNGQAGGAVTISTNLGESIVIDFEIGGFARPFLTPKPTHASAALLAAIEPIDGIQNVIIPPSFILAPMPGVSLAFPVAFRAVSAITDNNGSHSAGSVVTDSASGNNGYTISASGVELLHIGLKSIARTCDDAKYCALKWRDRLTGGDKCFTFELTAATYTTSQTTSLMRLDKQYAVKKGEIGSFTARLKALNVYDFMYYSDIVTADDVEATTDGATWKKVYIDTDTVTALNGNAETKDLEININFVRNEY